jgi:hypothetical protein
MFVRMVHPVKLKERVRHDAGVDLRDEVSPPSTGVGRPELSQAARTAHVASASADAKRKQT